MNEVCAVYKTLNENGSPESDCPLSMTRVGHPNALAKEDDFYVDETGAISLGPCDKPRQVTFTVEMPRK